MRCSPARRRRRPRLGALPLRRRRPREESPRTERPFRRLGQPDENEPAWGTLSASRSARGLRSTTGRRLSDGGPAALPSGRGDRRSSSRGRAPAGAGAAGPGSGRIPGPRAQPRCPGGFRVRRGSHSPGFPRTVPGCLAGCPRSRGPPRCSRSRRHRRRRERAALLLSEACLDPRRADAALDDALVEADVFRRYGLVEKALDQLRPWLERAPGNLRVREKLFEIFLEQGNRAEAREQAEILAEAYGVSGREDRIRGLEGLLGEPLRAVPSREVEVPVALVEPSCGRGRRRPGAGRGGAGNRRAGPRGSVEEAVAPEEPGRSIPCRGRGRAHGAARARRKLRLPCPRRWRSRRRM